MSADYAPAQWIPTSHFWSGRGGHAPRWIIIHGTAGGGSAQDVAHYFINNDPPTSTHFVVGRDGTVVQCVRESDSAWGNGVVTQGHDSWWTPKLNPNFVTFSIEHCKPDTNNASDLTQAQKEASFALIKHLCEKYNIPKRAADANGGITGHASIDPVNRAHCPGAYPWDELWGYLEGEPTVGVPSGWKDDGKTLTAPNGINVVLGFRWYILTHPWLADNWPIEAEHGENPIDITNPGFGAGTVQHFRKSILAWQKSTNDIIELWAGSNALAWQQRAQRAESAAAATSRTAATTPAPTPPAAQVAASSSAQVAAAAIPPLTARTVTQQDYVAMNRAQAPMAFTAPLSAALSDGTAIGGTVADGAAGDPPPGIAAVPAAPAPVYAAPAPTAAIASAPDAVSQRVASLEQQLQVLIEGLSTNRSTSKVVQGIERDLGLVGADLTNTKGVRSIFSNPKSLLRWLLMILGLLFSDAVAWALSAVMHHQISLPLPFLTAGTVLLSGLLVFTGAFRLNRP